MYKSFPKMKQKILSCVKAHGEVFFLHSSVGGIKKFDSHKQRFTFSKHPDAAESGVKMNISICAACFPFNNEIITQLRKR